jgi:peptide/nickel transport system ATP-binding protein
MRAVEPTIASSPDPLLETREVSTWIPTERGMLRAVDGVSLILKRGEALGVVGESGSGKSLLARSILNVLPPTAIRAGGSVLFNGRDLRQIPKRELRQVLGQQVGMVFQDPMTALNPVMRIERQLTEPLRSHSNLTRAARRLRALELMRRVGIPEAERRLACYPHELSGGTRQRVGIASALVCNPSLLIADEPTTALDVTIQRQILDLLSDLQRTNEMGLLLITHDLAVVAGRTDRVAVMYGGQVVEAAPTRDLFRSSRHPYTAALLGSIPKVTQSSHSRLAVIPGRPPRVIDPTPGCRFATRCPHAQPRCLNESPELTTNGSPAHQFRCFYPTGTVAGAEAMATNLATGRTAAGLPLNQTASAV